MNYWVGVAIEFGLPIQQSRSIQEQRTTKTTTSFSKKPLIPDFPFHLFCLGNSGPSLIPPFGDKFRGQALPSGLSKTESLLKELISPGVTNFESVIILVTNKSLKIKEGSLGLGFFADLTHQTRDGENLLYENFRFNSVGCHSLSSLAATSWDWLD